MVPVNRRSGERAAGRQARFTGTCRDRSFKLQLKPVFRNEPEEINSLPFQNYDTIDEKITATFPARPGLLLPNKKFEPAPTGTSCAWKKPEEINSVGLKLNSDKRKI